MGRPKKYEREDVTRRAMRVFWEKGFHATSTKELADQMGINSYSLFAEFGSKQGLYEAAMELYDREVVTGHFAALEAEDAGLDEVSAVFDLFARLSAASDSELGCFLCNTAVERAAFDEESQRYVASYLERVRDSLRNALTNAQRDGVLRRDIVCEEQSAVMAATLLGMWVMMRASGSEQAIAMSATAARSNLDRLRA